jgi:hypothetical protein
MESALSERTLRAEKMAEVAENKRISLEDEITGSPPSSLLAPLRAPSSVGLRQKFKESQLKVEELTDQLRTLESSLERMKRAEVASLERVQNLQNHLNEETSQRISLENALRDAEYRQKRVLEQKEDEKDSKIAEYEIQITLLRDQIEQQQHQQSRQPDQSSKSDDMKRKSQESGEQRRSEGGNQKKTKQQQQQPNYAAGSYLSLSPSLSDQLSPSPSDLWKPRTIPSQSQSEVIKQFFTKTKRLNISLDNFNKQRSSSCLSFPLLTRPPGPLTTSRPHGMRCLKK